MEFEDRDDSMWGIARFSAILYTFGGSDEGKDSRGNSEERNEASDAANNDSVHLSSL